MLALLAGLALIAQPPEGCLAAAAESALRAQGREAPDARALMREVHVFVDGVEPADLAEALERRGFQLLRFTPKPGELAAIVKVLPALVSLSPGHVVAAFEGEAMDPDGPRLFALDAAALARAEGSAAYVVLDHRAEHAAELRGLAPVRWRSENARYRSQVYASRAREPGADRAALLELAVKFAPQEAPLQNDLGVALAERGRYEDAVAAFDRALYADPGLEAATRNRDQAQRLLDAARKAGAATSTRVK